MRKSSSNKWPQKKEISHVANFCSIWPDEYGQIPLNRRNGRISSSAADPPTNPLLRTPWARIPKSELSPERLQGAPKPGSTHMGGVYAQVREVSCRVYPQRLPTYAKVGGGVGGWVPWWTARQVRRMASVLRLPALEMSLDPRTKLKSPRHPNEDSASAVRKQGAEHVPLQVMPIWGGGRET